MVSGPTDVTGVKDDLGYTIGNDIELMMRLLAKYRIKSLYIPKITVKMRIGGTSNRNLKNIYRQNVEIIRAARNNNIPINPLFFIVAKIVSRLEQYLSRPDKA